MSDSGHHSNGVSPEALAHLHQLTGMPVASPIDDLPDDVEALKRRLAEAEWIASVAESVVREARAREEGILDTLEHIGKRTKNAFSQNPRSILGERKSGSTGRSDLDVSTLFRTAAQITEEGIPETHYVIDGLVPAEALLLVSGIAKGGGKTTWATHGVKGFLAGTSFLGRDASQTPVVYLTEQPVANFYNGYLRPLGIHASDDLHILHGYLVAGVAWPDLVAAAVEKCLATGARVLIIDTFLYFAGLVGDQENSSGAVQEALRPLQNAVAEYGLTIILIHHDRKSGGDVYSAGRGSSALQAAVDLIINLALPAGNHRETIREMRTAGRYSEVPDKLLIELVEGKYVALGSESDVAAQVARRLALDVAPTDEGAALTMKELVEAAREHDSHVKKTTFENEVKKHVSSGKLLVIGAGKKGDPYKYYHPP